MKDFGLADIFQLIFVQQKTGVMTIWGATQTASVTFVKGMVVSAQIGSEGAVERVGTVLVRAKRITSAQLAEALKKQKDTSHYLGQILVNHELISQADLARALRFQILEVVYQLFRWKDGRYEFNPEEAGHRGDHLDPINTEHLLMEGVQRLDEWPSLEKRIPSPGVIFAAIPEKEAELNAMASEGARSSQKGQGTTRENDGDPFAELEDVDDARFTPSELKIYAAVNGVRTVQEIVESVEIGSFETYKALCRLLTAGFISRIDAVEAVEVLAVDTGIGSARRYLAGVGQAGLWAVNLAIGLFLLVGIAATWVWWDQGALAMTEIKRTLQTARALTVAHEVAELRELVQLWNVEHGGAPHDLSPVFDREPSGGRWHRTDPWGNRWVYNAETGEVWSSGPDGVPNTLDDVR